MDVVYPLVLFGFFGILAVFVCARSVAADEQPWLRLVLSAGLVLRLAMTTMFAVARSTRVFHEDADGYEYWGLRLAQSWHGLAPPMNPAVSLGQNYGYNYIAGAVYYVFGQFSPLLPFLNCVVGIVTIYVIYRLARQFFHPFVARRAALLCTFIPSMVLWHSVAMKDAVVTLLILIGLSSCVSLKRRFTVLGVVGVGFSILALQPIRFYMSYFVAFAVFLSLVLERGTSVFSGVFKQIFMVAAVVGLLVMAGVAGRAESDLQDMNLARVSEFRYGMAVTAKSGFDANTDVSTPGRAIVFLPIGMSELLFAPFPWQLTSMRSALALPETMLWWFMVPATVRGLRWSMRKRFGRISPLLLFAGTLTCAYSLVHGNVGSAFRQRAQIFVILFIFSSLGHWLRRCRKAGLDDTLLLVDEPQPAVAA